MILTKTSDLWKRVFPDPNQSTVSDLRKELDLLNNKLDQLIKATSVLLDHADPNSRYIRNIQIPQLERELKAMNQKFDNVVNRVHNLETVGDSAIALLKGLAQQIRDLRANPPEDIGPAADALAAEVGAKAAGWAADVLANTEAAETEPTPVEPPVTTTPETPTETAPETPAEPAPVVEPTAEGTSGTGDTGSGG